MNNVVAVLGCIGSGKTTLTQSIGDNLHNVHVTVEPVEIWKNDGILEAFYNDQKTLSYHMQSYAFITRLMCLKTAMEENPGKTVIVDGHVCSDKYVFKKVLRESGFISDIENTIYKKQYQYWNSVIPRPHKFVYVYLKTSPEQCFQRVKQRSRNEEVSIRVDYLQKLCDKFDQLAEKLRRQGHIVITIDGNSDKQSVLSKTLEELRTVL